MSSHFQPDPQAAKAVCDIVHQADSFLHPDPHKYQSYSDASLALEVLSPTPILCRSSLHQENEIYARALADRLAVARELILRRLIHRMQERPIFDNPSDLREWLTTYCADLDYEVFLVLFLDARYRLIEAEQVFRGTLNSMSVYPREVVASALRCGCCAVVLAHNHPSFAVEPSRCDEIITHDLKNALALVDIKLLDHFIVAGLEITSFAEKGVLS
jgi:DNA repair protein RadC